MQHIRFSWSRFPNHKDCLLLGSAAMATFTHLWATIHFGSILGPEHSAWDHIWLQFFYYLSFFFRWPFFQESGYFKFSSTTKQGDNTRIRLVASSSLIACPFDTNCLSALLFQKGIRYWHVDSRKHQLTMVNQYETIYPV